MSNPQPPRPAPSPVPPQSRPSAQTTQAIPPVPPASPAPPARARGGLQMVTLIVAVLALVFGLSGVVIAALALGRSDRAATLAANAQNAGPVVLQPTTAAPTPTSIATSTDEPTATDTPADPAATTSPGDISPTAQFQIAYEGEKLRIRSNSCSDYAQTYVDLDSPPRVGVASEVAEIGYNDCNPGKLNTELKFAQVAGSDATPADCLETIRTDPARSPVAPSRGMTLCFVTSQNTAAAQGITQKLVFVTIDSITTDNNTGVLNVTAKAWNVPQ